MLTDQHIRTVVAAALLEDAPWGDITSQSLIPAEAQATAMLTARESGIFSGGAVFAAAMELTSPLIATTVFVADGAGFERGDILAEVNGPARAVLQAERVALNFVQRMSGIATLTARYVAQVADSRARIVDTRKTTPGLRQFERHAVRSGGGHNHRFSLSDAVMAKDNHLAVLTAGGRDVTAVLLEVRERLSHTTHLEVEVDRIDQIEPVLAAGVDTIMLDNFSIEDMRRGVALVAGRALVEASGNVNIDTVGTIAATGVDLISVGALTHSVRALDLGLDIDIASDLASGSDSGLASGSASGLASGSAGAP
jgi:nicotinate-nucleotide pyrophosphorylase (carboxylating)